MKVFRSSLYQLYKRERAQSVQLQQIKDYMAAEHKTQVFSEDEIMAAIDKMMDDNQVMLSDNIVFMVWYSTGLNFVYILKLVNRIS